VSASFFSRTICLLFSLACGWPLGVNGSLSCNGEASTNLGLKDLRVQEKGGQTDPRSGPGRPAAQAHNGPVRSPLRCRGSSCICALCPSTCTILMRSSLRPRQRFSLHEVRSFTLQTSGMFVCNTSVPTAVGSDFIKLINTNKTP
jgi:hypothetical protein